MPASPGTQRRHEERLSPAARHPGIAYTRFLRRLARRSRPRSYLEIGTWKGNSLAAFDCDAICVDPEMKVRPEALDRDRTFIYQMTSDRYFEENDPLSVFPHGIDIAFLDGMHRFEYLLRDFMNTERCCHPQSMVLMHDCFPWAGIPTDRAEPRTPGLAWAGDVWKLVPILAEYREDLTLHMLDCPPTGLLLIQGLKPGSRTLQREYETIVQRYEPLTLAAFGIERLWSAVEPVSTRQLFEGREAWFSYFRRF
jgi:hypothetical protein